MESPVWHLFELLLTALGVAAPVLLYIHASRKADRKERAELHEQNSAKLNAILSENQYLPPHRHTERPGETLEADGIQYRPNGKAHG